MKLIALISIVLAGVFFSSCNEDYPDLQVVKNVDLNRYLGEWYEIARLPNRFEKGLFACTATYSMRDDGKIKVLNKGFKEDDPSIEKVAEGKAWLPDPNVTAKLKVSFFWIFAGDYWIIDLDENYQWAVVGNPDRDYFWILARNKTLPQDLIDGIIKRAEALGYNLNDLIFVKQKI